ncbi:MAG: hypothetical protein AMJ41_05280 [candidate division Zixibacteria bacterium DG_27]|nr:MAG: hypothetical protein AMJ41_05280 [candidate division Zixibacteria bacterium DG_27]
MSRSVFAPKGSFTSKLLLATLTICLAWFLHKVSSAEYYGIYGNGNSPADTVRINFTTLSGGVSGNLADPDSIVILRFYKESLLDSVTWKGSDNAIRKLRLGYFEYRIRASNASGDVGQYTLDRICFRGTSYPGFSGNYQVVEGGLFAKADSAVVASGSISQIAEVTTDSLEREEGMLATVRDTVGLTYHEVVTITGGGAHACSLHAFTIEDTTAIQAAFIRVMNNSENATASRGYTDSEGKAIFSLDPGTYKLWSWKAGQVFAPLPDTLIVAGSVNDTVWASTFDPGQPPEPELCRVYGWIYGLSGEGLAAVTISAKINQVPLRYESTIISPYYQSTTSDTSGYWYLDLYPNSALTPDDTQYEFMIYYSSGAVLRKKVTVPNQSSWQLSW